MKLSFYKCSDKKLSSLFGAATVISRNTGSKLALLAGSSALLLLFLIDVTNAFSSTSCSNQKHSNIALTYASKFIDNKIILSSLLKSNFLLSSSTSTSLYMSSETMSTLSKNSATIPSWSDLQQMVGNQPVGRALNNEVSLRKKGKGSAHVQNTLRLFDSKQQEPQITLYRDHAGWCPYCQKTMLLIEEKEVPVKIGLVPMRSYGDKPREFMQKVPSGLLPAIEVNGRIITESQVIMELLDKWHPAEDGYKPMLPKQDDEASLARYDLLAGLERELFSWWCTLAFRPEGPRLGGGGNPITNFFTGGGGGGSEMSSSMKGFLDCIRKVDDNLLKTKGPWFFDQYDYPTMIDFIYVSHVERMLASVAYWKGLDLRDPKWNLKGLNRWLEAFEKREAYLAFKSDYYTHVKDIPPQYGPGYEGGFEEDRIKMSDCILGFDGSWTLPLPHDDPLQPLYNGPPLPLCVLESMDLQPDSDGSYKTCDKTNMVVACRMMAGWKLAGNGENVAKFASRGGPMGSRNARKTFGAELADPYANNDEFVQPIVDAALRVVCSALIASETSPLPSDMHVAQLKAAVPDDKRTGVITSLEYLRDRIGVPRDLPLASARYLRAYLNWAINILD